jgi:hypothetical protein
MRSVRGHSAVVAFALAACGTSGGSLVEPDAAPDATGAESGDDARVRDGAAPDAADAGPMDAADGAAASACGIDVGGSLVEAMALITQAMKQGAPPGSNVLVVPTASQRDALAQTIVRVLGGDEAAACTLPASYRLVRMVDPSAGPLRLVAEVDANGRPAPSLYYGTFAAPRTVPVPSRALVVEAPHPIFDLDTERQATAVFVASAARYLLVAGAHRCADTAASVCSGTTSACNATVQPFRVSDAAHEDALVFQAIHVLLSDGDPQLQFLQLHGNGAACPTALVSDCSGSFADAGAAAALGAALTARGVTVGQCGAGYPSASCDLCGTDNVQARYTAGSPAACTQLGAHYGRFVHVEQQPSLRQAPDGGTAGYQPLIDAVLASYPPQ